MENCIFVLGIDGVPYSLLKKLIQKNRFPNLEKGVSSTNMKEIKSVYPVISSVAWTSFATGHNPAEHGIFGFVDRTDSPFQINIPTSNDRKSEPIWRTLSKYEKKVIVINVPITYPIEQVNGKMVSCFLCQDIKKGVYPKTLTSLLESHDYIIDADAWLARTDRDVFLKQIFRALNARFEVAMELIQEDWDYFQLHIMETDRLMHFFWYDIENEESPYYNDIVKFFEKLDWWIGQLFEKLGESCPIIILSDHGFCGIKHEVQMNTWLKKKGYLIMNENPYNLNDYNERSVCYSLLPGRFYINLEGREEKGSVSPADYEKVRREIKQQLLQFKDPKTGEQVIQNVFYREEIYSGPYLESAADIIAHPNNGYDLKGMQQNEDIFTNSALNGMHTYEDAVIIGKNFDIHNINTIADVNQKIKNYLGIEVKKDK